MGSIPGGCVSNDELIIQDNIKTPNNNQNIKQPKLKFHNIFANNLTAFYHADPQHLLFKNNTFKIFKIFLKNYELNGSEKETINSIYNKSNITHDTKLISVLNWLFTKDYMYTTDAHCFLADYNKAKLWFHQYRCNIQKYMRVKIAMNSNELYNIICKNTNYISRKYITNMKSKLIDKCYTNLNESQINWLIIGYMKEYSDNIPNCIVSVVRNYYTQTKFDKYIDIKNSKDNKEMCFVKISERINKLNETVLILFSWNINRNDFINVSKYSIQQRFSLNNINLNSLSNDDTHTSVSSPQLNSFKNRKLTPTDYIRNKNFIN